MMTNTTNYLSARNTLTFSVLYRKLKDERYFAVKTRLIAHQDTANGIAIYGKQGSERPSLIMRNDVEKKRSSTNILREFGIRSIDNHPASISRLVSVIPRSDAE